MGRKIPAKKHRGVKDPLEQQARRLQSVKGKINAPPADPDEQPVPRSLQRLFAPVAARKSPRAAARRHGDGHAKGGASGARANPVSRLRALPGESAREFSLRINSAVRALAGDAHGEQSYPVEDDGEELDTKGSRMADLRQRRARKERRRAARPGPAAAAAPAEPAAPALTRTQKQALKKKAKKENTSEELREVRVERVPFGEVAHAPPVLRPPRGLPAGAGAPRPGRRGLLLSALLPGAAPASPAGAADARRRDRARLDAVAAYRALKAQRRPPAPRARARP